MNPAPAEEVIYLPSVKRPAVITNPRNLVIFSKPKTGKTSLLAGLPGCLILDINKGGADFVDAMTLRASSLNEIRKIGRAIINAGKPYWCVAIDTGTDLEEMCIPYAEDIYSKTAMGKYWFYDKDNYGWWMTKPGPDGQPVPSEALKTKYGSILSLPEGGGYFYLRQAFEEILAYIRSWAPYSILSCHLKDTLLDSDNKIVDPAGLDLTGKIKRNVASGADAIGYLYRKGNQNILSFRTSDAVNCGARPPHLRSQDIVASEYDPKTGIVSTFWDKIFLPEPGVMMRPNLPPPPPPVPVQQAA